VKLKLTFPNGEHEPVMLEDGVNAVGTGADCRVMLAAPGIALNHCEIRLRGFQASVYVTAPENVVLLNGRQVSQEAPLKSGDLLLFAKVGCQVAVVMPAAPGAARPLLGDGDDGRTRIRQTLPKYILRGVSGPTFGKNFALAGTMTVGRQTDCDIPVPVEEISRQHVRLQVTPEGVMVEDLGSANGTFINDKRIHNGLLRPGEELRLDTVRFILMSPSMESARPPAAAAAPAKPAGSGVGAGLWIAIGVGLLLLAAAAAYHFGMF